MKQSQRKNESSQTFSSTGYESFSITPSTSVQKKHDLLYLFKKLNVNQKYIDIQLAHNYKFEDIEKLNEEEFALKFQAENREEFDELSEIYMRLMSETLPESCEMQRIISVSNSANDNDNDEDFFNSQNKEEEQKYSENDQEGIQNGSRYNRIAQHRHTNSHLSNFNNFANFDTQSQYQFAPVNMRDQSLAMPQFVTNLSQTVFYNSKQLPYNPFDFQTFAYMTQSISISPEQEVLQVQQQAQKINEAQIVSIVSQLKQIATVFHKHNPMLLDDSIFRHNIQKQHMYFKISEKDAKDKHITNKYNRILYQGDAFSVGRHSTSSIVLNSDSVSRHHARFQAKDGKYFVQDLASSTGTFIRLKSDYEYQIFPCSIFMCGITEFKITKMILEEDSAQISLQIISGNKNNKVFDFNIIIKSKKSCLIGTNIQCDVSAIDRLMERYHSSLVYKKGQVLLMDLSSQSGTWVRLSPSKQESEWHQIQDGQTILITPYQIKGFIQNQ